MAQKSSKQFGALVAEMLGELGLSHMAASEATNFAVSSTYWSLMRAGQVPSFDIVESIANTEAFKPWASALRSAAGYTRQYDVLMPAEMSVRERGILREAAGALERITGIPAEEIVEDTLKRYGFDSQNLKEG